MYHSLHVHSQDAFWAMVVLIGSQRYAMHGMLIPGLPKLLAYCELHGRVRRRYLPKLDRHFVSCCLMHRGNGEGKGGGKGREEGKDGGRGKEERRRGEKRGGKGEGGRYALNILTFNP